MRKVEYPDLNIVSEQYDSIAEFYRVNEARGLNEAYKDRGDYSAARRQDVTDSLDYDWEQSKHDMMLGSDVFDEEFKKALDDISKQVPKSWSSSTRNRLSMDVVGQSVSVERAMSNHPKAFNRRKPVRIKQKTVSFLFSISCPWSTPTRDRLRAGVILMVICERLEEMGYQTRIMYAPDFSYGDGGSRWDTKDNPTMCALMTLKDFKTRFNLKKMQFPLASRSALFHVGCWWNHRTPLQKNCWGDGEGYSVDNNDGRREKAIEFAHRQGGIYLSVPMIRNDFDMDLMKVYDFVMFELGK